MYQYQRLPGDEKIRELLLRCDRDLAKELRKGGCLVCSGRLDQANYPRKPRGDDSNPDSVFRLSFCCCVEGCRKRATPRSVRFLGRKVYLGMAVVIAGVLGQAGSGVGAGQLQKLLGVSRRTLQRWRRWWRTLFVESRFWQAARGQFQTPIAAADLPRDLLDCFPGNARGRVIALLRFLSPLTTGSLPESPAF
ncbi:MAG: hypothetical protein ABIK89_22225 [Planctomycetota bacterium]